MAVDHRNYAWSVTLIRTYGNILIFFVQKGFHEKSCFFAKCYNSLTVISKKR